MTFGGKYAPLRNSAYSTIIRHLISRIIASAAWSYKWGCAHIQHRIDLLDINNYLYMPSISQEFRDKYLNNEQNYILKYNYTPPDCSYEGIVIHTIAQDKP